MTHGFAPEPRRVEERLLLDCSRATLTPAAVERVKGMLQGELNWERLLQTASWHNVLPLVCHHLIQRFSDLVPAGVLREVQVRFRTNSARNLYLAAELLTILRFLEENGIAALPFKGPALAMAAYGNLALRQFCDLDVLVEKRDFPQAKALFLAHGFQPWQELTPLEEERHLRSSHSYTLVRTNDGLKLDLHWRITQERYAFELDVASLWSRLQRISFCGRSVLAMAPEDLLLVLCLHGSKHNWERLGWICDMAEVVRANPELRWEEILSRSHALHISRAVLLGIDLAGTLLDAPVPEPIVSAIRDDRGVHRVSSLMQKRLFARSRPIGPLESAALFFMTREQLRNKLPHLAYSFRRAVTPNEIDTRLLSLPGFFYFLYYPLRAARLTRTAVSRFFGRAR